MRTGAAGQYVGVVLAVVVALLCSGSRPASATHDVEGRRLTGENRFETAAAIARREPGRAEHALLARADDFPDALAAAALAGRLGAPILLTGRDELPEPTTDALVALGVEAVTLLGGPAAIGPEVQRQLASRYEVRRLAGSSRFGTAAAIASEVAAGAAIDSGPGSRTAILVNGLRFADVLAAGAPAAAATLPILLTADEVLPEETAAVLDDLDIRRVLLIGGPEAIPLELERGLQADGLQTDRIAGATRDATAAAVADYAIESLSFVPDEVFLARGDDFADALAAAPYAAARRAPILLAARDGIGAATDAWLHRSCPDVRTLVAVGGEAAVSASAVLQAQASAGGCHAELTGECLADEPGPFAHHGDESTASTLSDVLFVTDRQGYVVGDSRILATADGGETWQTQLRAHAHLRSVNFVDAQHGWAVGLDRILATDDGGACWRDLPMPAPALERVQFHSPEDGIALAQEPESAFLGGDPPPATTLFRTSDGGQRWEPITTPAPVQSACFTDDLQGWALTERDSSAVLRTLDGGETWTEPLDPGPRWRGEVQCAPLGTVWMLLTGDGAAGHVQYEAYRGSDRSGFHLVACNGFFPGCDDMPGTGGSYPGPFSSLNEYSAVFFGWTPARFPDSDQVRFTAFTDAGRGVSGAPTPVPGMYSPISAAFRSPSLGWVIGDQASLGPYRIVRTTDGGASWTVQLEVPSG